MSRISRSALFRAIKVVQEMTAEQKLGLADEIFLSQPNMLASVVVLRSLGVPAAKQAFALEMLFLCFQAMKESGLKWPLITEDEQENQMQRHTAILQFYGSLDKKAEQNSSAQQFIGSYPEQDLFAWVTTQSREWLLKSDPEESDKYVLQAILNLVNCLAFVTMPVDVSRRMK